jgi:hypothetical protein
MHIPAFVQLVDISGTVPNKGGGSDVRPVQRMALILNGDAAAVWIVRLSLPSACLRLHWPPLLACRSVRSRSEPLSGTVRLVVVLNALMGLPR